MSAADGPLCPERRAVASVGGPLHGVTCPVCNASPGRWCLTVADALAMLDAAKEELRLVRAGWAAHLATCAPVADPREGDSARTVAVEDSNAFGRVRLDGDPAEPGRVRLWEAGEKARGAT